jgi:hypothetical protein
MSQTEQLDDGRMPGELAEELAQNRAPTRDEWEAALGKWRGRADIRPLLAYGTRKGWIGDY